MSQQLLDQAERLSSIVEITGHGRSHAHKIAEGYPLTQVKISEPRSSLRDILETFQDEYRSIYTEAPNRDIDRVGQQLITALLRRGL